MLIPYEGQVLKHADPDTLMQLVIEGMAARWINLGVPFFGVDPTTQVPMFYQFQFRACNPK